MEDSPLSLSSVEDKESLSRVGGGIMVMMMMKNKIDERRKKN
jgi:hypothetical protein